MKQRVITAVVALIVFIPIIVYGGIAIELAAAALSCIALLRHFVVSGSLFV